MSIEVTLNTLSTFSEHTSSKIKSLLEEASSNVVIDVKDISLLDQWEFSKETFNISHVSGKFFSIIGVQEIDTNNIIVREQAIINQPEIGLLGLIVRKRNGGVECLVQAKMEPGNINLVQLSPTLQATYSNYTSVHKGKKPLFLDFFLENHKHKVLANILQPEQTHKFLKKINRNIVVQVDTEFEIPSSFIWIKFEELKKFQLIDNLVNMDLRSILSSIRIPKKNGTFEFSSLKEIDNWINENSSLSAYKANLIELKNITSCIYEAGVLKDIKNAFEVIGVHVQTNLREVSEWSQPLIRVPKNGKYGFIIAKIEGVIHFLVRFHPHIGSMDNLELTTSFDSIDENSMTLYDHALKLESSKIHFKCLQSEEGGRFYHYVNENILIEVVDYTLITLGSKFKWLTFDQVHHYLNKGYFSMEARSIFSIYTESK